MRFKTGLMMKLSKNDFSAYIEAFLAENAKVNLISKNDEKFLWEKHIFDSLAIENFFEKYGIRKSLLDIGTGGGFPSVPAAIAYPELEVYALDSIRKKLNAIENIKSALNLKNLHTICERAENLTDKYELVTSRAVASMKVLSKYASRLLSNGGYFVAYKSIKAQDEINEALPILRKNGLKVEDIIEYNLPLEENYVRIFVFFKKY